MGCYGRGGPRVSQFGRVAHWALEHTSYQVNCSGATKLKKPLQHDHDCYAGSVRRINRAVCTLQFPVSANMLCNEDAASF